MSETEPVAIVGMACRFAGGVDTPQAFWRLLRDGGDVIGKVPDGRWDGYAARGPEHAAVVRRTTAFGAFLDDVAGFDAAFFDITPREAALMDPQQRLVLELAWEALEHAGIPPAALAGTDTGVYVGVGADDYGRRLLEDLPRIEAWSGVGAGYCGVANRVSHALDLRGPSLATDTACSSSLVALHLAVRALRAGECPVALVGGVLVMAAPGLSVVLDAAGATSPDGRCKSFDAHADGYGRGEGGGMLVLKRLADAHRDGDRVLAVVRGSAVRQDGRTNGIMAPSGPAQAHLLRAAYANAGIDPLTVGYVEAHGTGTPVGDPLEAGAIAEVLGAGRPPGEPCLIGSVKPNVGHLEAGAGVAGVIKAVLALRHGEIPASLNCDTPTPAVDWDGGGLRVATRRTPWPAADGPRRAGVSGYGYGGTIAHVVLEAAAPDPEPVAGPDAVAGPDPVAGPEPAVGPDAVAAPAAGPRSAPRLVPVSAASPAALRAQAARLAAALAAAPDDPGHGDLAGGAPGRRDVERALDGVTLDGVTLDDVGHTLATRRDPLPVRAALAAPDLAGLRAQLLELAADRIPVGRAPRAADRGPVWVFSGQGSQWVGMGRELLDGDPRFAAVLARLEPVFTAELGVSPAAVLRTGAPWSTDVVQPMIFAVQVGLAAVWRGYGVRPAAVVGHSVGEIAAAVTAGVLDLEDGARLVCRRSLLLRGVVGQGRMAWVGTAAADAAHRLRAAGTDPAVVVAVSAGPASAVLSGPPDALAAACAALRDGGVAVRDVDSDVAFHGPAMDGLTGPLAAAVGELRPRQPRLPLYSTALRNPRSPRPRDGAYWAQNLRGRVRFDAAIAAAAADGHRTFLEVSPHPVVQHSIDEILTGLGIADPVLAHTLRRDRPERQQVLANLAELYRHGTPVDWSASWPAGRLAELPTVAWERRPHWVEEPVPSTPRPATHDPQAHTLLGARTELPGADPVGTWRTRLDHDTRPYPGQHPVRGVEIVPAAVLLLTFLEAAAAHTGRWAALRDVALRVPVSVTRPRDVLVSARDGALRLSTRLLADPADTGAGPPDGDEQGWLTHTVAGIAAAGATPATPAAPATPDASTTPDASNAVAPLARADGTTGALVQRPGGFVAQRLATLGVAAMGFPWRITALYTGADRLVLSADPGQGARTWAAALDAVLSAASVVFRGDPVLRMPAAIAAVELAADAPAGFTADVLVTGPDTVDVTITTAAGRPAGRLTGLRYGRPDAGETDTTAAAPHRLTHRMRWVPAPADSAAAPAGTAADSAAAPVGAAPTVTLVGPPSPLRTALAARLDGAGLLRGVVDGPDRLPDPPAGTAVLVVPGADAGPLAARAAGWLLARTAQLLGAGAARLWCVTQGVRDCADPTALAHAATWGVARVLGTELPELWGGLVDLEDTTPASVDALVQALRRGPAAAGTPGEDVVAVRAGRLEVPRLVPTGPAVRGPLRCDPAASYLVTGGLGALGRQVTEWLADRGMRRVIVAARTPLPPRRQWSTVRDPAVRARVDAVLALERRGVTVTPVAVDVADPQRARRLLDTEALGLPPVRGVVHAAGALDDRLLRELDEESLATVLAPKVDGAHVLHELYPPGSVDFLVLFSSCGYLLGLPGQAAYGAANAVLDALARHRAGRGDDAVLGLGFTSWRGLGMSTHSGVVDLELAARGTGDVTAAQALACWELAHRGGPGYAAVLRTTTGDAGAQPPPLLAEIAAEAPVPAAAARQADPWRQLTGSARADAVAAEVAAQVAAVTGMAVPDVDRHRPLAELGLDSVMTVQVRRALERRFGVRLATTVFWDHPTVAAVAAVLADRTEEAAA